MCVETSGYSAWTFRPPRHKESVVLYLFVIIMKIIKINFSFEKKKLTELH